MSSSPGQNSGSSPPPSAAGSTFSKSRASVRSDHRPQPSTLRTVVTSPPWARDEPPSPKDEVAPPHKDPLQDPRPSDVASYQSSTVEEDLSGPSRWWAFTRYRPGESARQPLASLAARHGRDRSLSISWLPSSMNHRSAENSPVREMDGENLHRTETVRSLDRPGLRLELPSPVPMTIAQARTPGWDLPWSPSAPGETEDRVDWNVDNHSSDAQGGDDEKRSRWQRRKKRIRVYMLTNVYVPLLFRVVNISFTTAALAVSIRIRLLEARHHITGALGSSPTLVIIFAPLTLVHVMIAIYLEYFGRPLGLWHTSGKLAHTLTEVVFICAWSAALALSFDNFFTSIIPCASSSSISWYNKLPRPDPLPGVSSAEGGIGETVCDEQLALICLVGVGLIMYCFNLVISLFRIFEKVKYHPPAQRG